MIATIFDPPDAPGQMPDTGSGRGRDTAHGFARTTERIHPGERVRFSIEKLIMDADEPEQKALLIVLQEIISVQAATGEALEANSALTRGAAEDLVGLRNEFFLHTQKFDKHAGDEMVAFAKAISSWKTLAYLGPVFVTVVCALLLYIFSGYVTALGKQADAVDGVRVDLAKLKNDIVDLQNTVTRNTGIINDRVLGLGNSPPTVFAPAPARPVAPPALVFPKMGNPDQKP